MSIKTVLKNSIQKILFSPAVYGALKQRALACGKVNVPDALDVLERVSPRPVGIRAEATELPEPTVDLSVIVPIYNVEKYLEPCLRSILSQEVDATMEVLAIIDGSPDESERIAREIAAQDERLKVVVQKNRGLSAARNAGIEVSRGRWIAFIDSDDMLAQGHFSALVARMRRGDCDVVGALWRRMAEDGSVGEVGETCRTHMAPWGRLYKREVWERLRFPVGCWYEDLITPCCIQPMFHEVFIEDAGYLYRSRPGSIVEESSCNPKALDAFWSLEEMLGWRRDLGFELDVEDWRRLVWIMGPLTMGRTTFLDNSARRALFSAMCDLVSSLGELSDVGAHIDGRWQDAELALRGRYYELWCLACAALAKDSSSIKMTTAWDIYRKARLAG